MNGVGILFWTLVLLFLYTYFGYPLLLGLLTRWIRKEINQNPGEQPSVTLLIAAYNEAAVIQDKIQNALSLDYPPEKLQILITTDGSDDETPQIVKTFASEGIDLLHTPERGGKMAAIDRAVPYARGDIIVFSDANNFYEPDTLTRLVAPFGIRGFGRVILEI
jgi:cellulose synthase/poly-beta-1,6-N-acetylglucosamine synthase-like glycosyltransferase